MMLIGSRCKPVTLCGVCGFGSLSTESVASLEDRVLKIGNPVSPVGPILKQRVEEGGEVTQPQLQHLVFRLSQSRCFTHALQVSDNERNYDLSLGGIAKRINLISKVCGLEQAERFFRGIPDAKIGFKIYERRIHNQVRRLSVWSMKKEVELEWALSRNRRWVVNNQIKNIILRYPNKEIPIATLQKKFKTLDLQGKALNWLSKYPCCFEVHEDRCRLTKRMMNLVAEEQSLVNSHEPFFVRRLAKLLMLTLHNRLAVLKINHFKRSFGFPDDYLIRIVPSYPNLFRIVNESGRRSSMAIELLHWDPDLAVSAVEASAMKLGTLPRFSCSLPSTWVKSWERFREFDEIPYFSPYSDQRGLVEGSKEMEKRNVGLVHELLSLTLWKKASIVKLSHFRREFVLPDRLNVLLLKHPGIFYVSNKYKIYTVLLREAYVGSHLVDKDPLVLVKDKFGELMQEGLHEYNQRRRLLNVEKSRKKGVPLISVDGAKGTRRSREVSDDDDGDGKVGRLFDPEERKRFYRVLFDDDAS